MSTKLSWAPCRFSPVMSNKCNSALLKMTHTKMDRYHLAPHALWVFVPKVLYFSHDTWHGMSSPPALRFCLHLDKDNVYQSHSLNRGPHSLTFIPPCCSWKWCWTRMSCRGRNRLGRSVYADPHFSLVLYSQHGDLHFRVGVRKEEEAFLCRKHTMIDDFSGQILILFITMFIRHFFSCQLNYFVGRRYFLIFSKIWQRNKICS